MASLSTAVIEGLMPDAVSRRIISRHMEMNSELRAMVVFFIV